MKRLVFIIIVISFYCINNNVYSQSNYTDHRSFHSEIDSLEYMIDNNSLNEEDLLQAYYKLSFAYGESDQDKYAYYSLLAMRLAHKMNDYVTEIHTTRNYISYLSSNNKNDSIMYYYGRAVVCLENIENTCSQEIIDREFSLLHATMGNYYNYMGDVLKAIEEYQMALPIFEKYDRKESQLILYSNVASLYISIENLDQAEVNMLKALNISKEINDSLMIVYVYHDLCELELHRHNYDKAKEYATICHDYFKNHSENGLEFSEIHCILAMIYRADYKDYTKAEFHGKQALEIARNHKSVPHTSNAHLELGKIYIEMEDWQNAKNNILTALSLQDTDPAGVIACHRNLVKIYIHLNEPDQAIAHFNKVNELQNRLSNKEFQSSISEMEVLYETEKKELRIEALEKEKKLQLWIAAFIILLFLSCTALFFFLWIWSREKHRIIKQMKDLEIIEARMKGEYDERIRLSRDLHDGLGGMLTSVNLKMELMLQNHLSNKDYNEVFHESNTILKESIIELRRISHHLMPLSLRTNGLKSALNDYCNSFSNVDFNFYGQETRLDSQMEMLIYRLIHELVNNAIKHSGADTIKVQVMQESDYIAIIVSDNGCGFDTESISEGMGLSNIKERVESRNGRLEILSEIGKGTDINIEFKLN